MIIDLGIVLSLIGAALAIIGGGIGTIYGTMFVASTGSGVVSREPKLFGTVLLFSALPSSQGIYGFLTAILITQNTGFLAGTAEPVSVATGLALLASSLPIAFLGLFSGFGQGKVLQNALKIIISNPSDMGKAIILGALMESMAVFGLLLSILIINNI